MSLADSAIRQEARGLEGCSLGFLCNLGLYNLCEWTKLWRRQYLSNDQASALMLWCDPS